MSSKHQDCWKFLDDLHINVYCICLKERDDRYLSACKALSQVGLLSRTLFHRPRKHNKGYVGCWQSHLSCIQHSYKHGNKAALIFEDDIMFTENWKDQLVNIQTFLEKEPDWNLFRIGSYVLKYWDAATSTDNVWRASVVQTHAYFVHHSYMKALLHSRSPKFVNHIDAYYNHSTTKDYALLNLIVYQDAKLGSDNLWNFKFKGINIDFGLITQKAAQQFIDFEQLQKANNFVAYYLRYLPKEYRFYTLPNIIHHQIEEPVLLL